MSSLTNERSSNPGASKLVAIGGSTEGLSSITGLIGLIPPTTGLAYAVVVDGFRDESDLLARLRSQTRLPVVVVAETAIPEPDHVYIAKDGHDLVVEGKRLTSAVPLATNGTRCTIDRLLRSVASDFGSCAVAVIAGGVGGDGSIGLKLVKEWGGITIAQAPGESDPDEMSRMAIATGFVDYILPLSKIAEQLNHIDGRAPGVVDDGLSDDLLRELLVLLRVRTGHDFSHYKRATLLRRVARRMQVTESATLEQYLRVARQEPTELASLLRDFMISVTNFFRDPEAFATLGTTVLPGLFREVSADPIRVWVAGCATGEEVYSLAIMLMEARAQIDPQRQIQIFATDIDDDALVEAREGRYLNTIAADVSPSRLERFFTKDGDYVRVSKDLRELVLFASHNVLRDAPFSRLDIMSCRNLLIYLDKTMQEQVLRTAHFSLKHDRYLMLGSSENADTSERLFEPLDPKSRIYIRQPRRAMLVPIAGAPPRWSVPSLPVAPRAEPSVAPSVGEAHFRIVERYGAPSILVSSRFEIAHLSERAGRYLEAPPGEPTLDVFQMVLPELRLDLRAAAYAARRKPGLVVSTMTRCHIDGEPRLIRMAVLVEKAHDQDRANLVVWFEESDVAVESPAADVSEKGPPIEPVVRQLEDELRHAREQLRTTIEQYETLVEELHASNEELQAINEELRSASEEVEASREETDSVNQELTTVNSELKARIDETTAAKSDIANLMESSDVGVIFVDRELRIHRFTQRAREIFNIRDSDVGRPLTDLASKISYVDLVSDTRAVLETLGSTEREVRHKNGDRYLVRLRPYRSLDDRIAGVVMTFVDTTALRRTEEALLSKDTMLKLAERAASAGAWELDEAGRLRMSEQCHQLYGTAATTDAVPTSDWMRNVREEKRGRLEKEIAAALQGGRAAGLDVEIQIVHPEKGERWLWMLGRRIDGTSEIAGITLDVTAARAAHRALEAADQRKNEFIATLAHELRNPLTPLTLALGIQAHPEASPEDLATARSMMERQVAQLRRLVDDLLDVSRIQTGRLELRIEESIPLWSVVTDAAEAVSGIVQELHHKLRLDVPKDARLDGDRVRLTQVFVNLLTNAAKYTEPGGTISVNATSDADFVRVSVTDNGLGIAPEVLPRIFDLFAQAEPILTRARGGIGIGLNLVKQLVALHGGTIDAQSAGLGKGSSFSVTLPVCQPKGSS